MKELFKENRLAKVVFLVSIICLFLPWFTFGSEMTPFNGLSLSWIFPITYGFIAAYLFLSYRAAWLAALAKVSALAQVVLCVVSIGKWEEWANIAGGWNWSDGLAAAQPTYWISLAVYVVLLIVVTAAKRR